LRAALNRRRAAAYRFSMTRAAHLSLVLAATLALACSRAEQAPPEPKAAAPQADFIEGRVISGEAHPEAGVWVIAETSALPTPYRKIVVTDDAGRFVLPELPDAPYEVWVRGYGLEDAPRVPARRGEALELRVRLAETPQQAAAIYPASYWLSLLDPPAGSAAWMNQFKLGCQLCHQVGSVVTRNKTRALYDAGLRKAAVMHTTADALGRARLLDALAAWSGRIADGALPEPPPRPHDVERNVVITQWAWGDATTYAHDEVATDKRDPRVNANGPIYGVDIGNDHVLALDPNAHRASAVKTPTQGGFATPWCAQTYRPLGGGRELPVGFGSLGCPAPGGASSLPDAYANPANPHNPMLDAQGRVWITTQLRREWGDDLPDFCKRSPVIARNYHHRQLGVYDPRTGATTLIDTCYGTHHLQFDAQGRLWTSGDSYVIGWLDPERYDPAQPETLAAAQGWSEIVVDTNGDAKPDRALVGFNYGIIPNPLDGSVWTAQPGNDPGAPFEQRGRLVRYDPKADRHETYIPPAPGAGPRGVDVDTQGVIWVALGGSGHLAKFERAKCKQRWGAGEQCAEGWTLYRSPGPALRTRPNDSGELGSDFHYYLFVDQWGTLGLGKDVVIVNGTGSDALLAFDPRAEKWTVIRIPYPLVTYTRGLDGRIDDPNTGWKGRALWFTNGLDPLLHSEIPQSYVGKVQLRPDPLAR
jgi:streptogramin lyase